MRPLLQLVALLVAGGSLVTQGLTLGPLIAWVRPQTADPAEEVAEEVIEPLTREQVRDLAIEAIHTQRDALVEARDEGLFHSSSLELALERLDAEEIMLSGY